ncbi:MULTISPECIES: copper resistance D family protein [Gordonia]|uniref:copper resistance D family protein n=1 Tax=Gordonia TaxID=2053 RepID=UPI001FE9C4EA|nr:MULTISPECIES: CopD family protein [Gordonia]
MTPADGRTRALLVVACVPVMAVGLVAARLSGAAGGAADTAGAGSLPAVVTLAAAVLLIGLGTLPALGAAPSPMAVGVVGGVWAAASLVAAWARAADQVGVGVGEVALGQFSEVMRHGAPDLVAATCALAVIGWACADLITDTSVPVQSVAVLGGVGLVAVAISAHPGTHAVMPVLVAVHALAAAWWCGTLAALVLSVRGRSGWARSLPRFSELAPWAVLALVPTGVVSAIIELGSVSSLFTTGYGLIVVGKSVGLGLLVAIAARHRRRWVPDAARHRGTENQAIRRAATQLAVMAVVLGLAVGLSVTAP